MNISNILEKINELENTLEEVKHALEQARENAWIVNLLKEVIKFDRKKPEIQYDKSNNDIHKIITGVTLQIQRELENSERWLLRNWILRECFPEEFEKDNLLKRKKKNK